MASTGATEEDRGIFVGALARLGTLQSIQAEPSHPPATPPESTETPAAVCQCSKNPHFRSSATLPLELYCTACGLPPSNTEGFKPFKAGKGTVTFWAKPEVLYGLFSLFCFHFSFLLSYLRICVLIIFSKEEKRIVSRAKIASSKSVNYCIYVAIYVACELLHICDSC